MREVIQTCLEDAGNSCVGARTVRAALAVLDQPWPVHAVVTDLMMPGESAIPLIEHCRLRQVPVAVLTGLTEETARRLCPPGILIMSKPQDIDEIIALVRQMVAGPGGEVAQRSIDQTPDL